MFDGGFKLRKIFLLIIMAVMLSVIITGCNNSTPTPKSRELKHPGFPNIVFRVDADGSVRGPLYYSITGAVRKGLEEDLGFMPETQKDMTLEEEALLEKEKAFAGQMVPSSLRELLARYFWPKNEHSIIKFKEFKEEVAQIEKQWEKALLEISATEELTEIPIVQAVIADVNRAFEELRKASPTLRRKHLISAYSILCDLEEIWYGANPTSPPPYGVTTTEAALREITPEHIRAALNEIKEEMLAGNETRTAKIMPGFEFDEANMKFVHSETGIWFLGDEDGRVLILPAEQYAEPKDIDEIYRITGENSLWGIWYPENIVVEDRPEEAWQLAEIKEVPIQQGDTFSSLYSQHIAELQWQRHFRMDRQWYLEQLKNVNDTEDLNLIRAGDVLRIPINIDKDSLN